MATVPTDLDSLVTFDPAAWRVRTTDARFTRRDEAPFVVVIERTDGTLVPETDRYGSAVIRTQQDAASSVHWNIRYGLRARALPLA